MVGCPAPAIRRLVDLCGDRNYVRGFLPRSLGRSPQLQRLSMQSRRWSRCVGRRTSTYPLVCAGVFLLHSFEITDTPGPGSRRLGARSRVIGATRICGE